MFEFLLLFHSNVPLLAEVSGYWAQDMPHALSSAWSLGLCGVEFGRFGGGGKGGNNPACREQRTEVLLFSFTKHLILRSAV